MKELGNSQILSETGLPLRTDITPEPSEVPKKNPDATHFVTSGECSVEANPITIATVARRGDLDPARFDQAVTASGRRLRYRIARAVPKLIPTSQIAIE